MHSLSKVSMYFVWRTTFVATFCFSKFSGVFAEVQYFLSLSLSLSSSSDLPLSRSVALHEQPHLDRVVPGYEGHAGVGPERAELRRGGRPGDAPADDDGGAAKGQRSRRWSRSNVAGFASLLLLRRRRALV